MCESVAEAYERICDTPEKRQKFRDFMMSDFYGGLVRKIPSEQIPKNQPEKIELTD